jgi:hypothetical protein
MLPEAFDCAIAGWLIAIASAVVPKAIDKARTKTVFLSILLPYCLRHGIGWAVPVFDQLTAASLEAAAAPTGLSIHETDYGNTAGYVRQPNLALVK